MSTSVQYNCDFEFKGGRDYVHGTDLYTTLAEHLGTGCLEMVIRRPVTHQLRLRVILGQEDRPAYRKSVPVWYRSGECHGYFVEMDRPVTEHYHYDESGIESAAQVDTDGMSAVLPALYQYRYQYSPVEMVVALNKVLHQRLFPGQRWVLTRLEVDYELVAGVTTEVAITGRTLQQDGIPKHTLASISTGGSKRGSIRFTAVGESWNTGT